MSLQSLSGVIETSSQFAVGLCMPGAGEEGSDPSLTGAGPREGGGWDSMKGRRGGTEGSLETDLRECVRY